MGRVHLPLQAQVAQMRAQNAGNAIAESVYDFHDTEIEMYRRYHSCYGYRFVLLQRAELICAIASNRMAGECFTFR